MAGGKINAILGGHCNNDNGCCYAGIFGCGIIAVACNTFHVECLNACNTPCSSTMGSVPVGTIFLCNSIPPINSFPLWIQL